MKLGVENFFFKIPIGRTIFNFSCKTSGFMPGYLLFWVNFWSSFCHFFMQKFCFLRGWVVFLSKKKLFFSCKTSVFAGLGALFGTFFCHFFVIFLKCANPARRSARSARGLTRDAKAVSGKPEGTIFV